MLEIAGEGGYSAVTVRELASLAGVSTRAFYTHFHDKDECVLQTYELVVQRAAARIAAAQSGERDWRERMRRAFAAYTREVAENPRAARLALLEPYAIGPAALERATRTDRVFKAMLAESFARAPGGSEVSPLFLGGIVAGVSSVTRARLLAGNEREMPALSDQLLEWALSYRDEAAGGLTELDQRSSLVSVSPEPTAIRPGAGAKHAREDDRTLILTAVAKLAASEGYPDLTVPRIRAAAGVSRRNFDANFEGVKDCFLAALELRTAEALESAAAQATGKDWAADVYRTIAALCTRVARDPRLAKLAFVEVVETGLDGLRCREEMAKTIAELFRAGAPAGRRPGRVAVEASVGAIWGILHRYVTSGRAQELQRIAATLSFLALAPAIGAPQATEAIRREQERS
jgi:AcrR family transcriptional regulator